MVYRILLEKRFIGFITRYRPIRLNQCCAQLKSFGNKTFFLVFPFDLNMNAALSCKRFGCASFGQFKHVVFKIHHVPFSNSKSGILVDRILLEKGFLLFGALVEDMLVFSLDSLEKLISHSSLRDSGKHINKVYFHPHEKRNMQISERIKFRRYFTLLIISFVFLQRIVPYFYKGLFLVKYND